MIQTWPPWYANCVLCLDTHRTRKVIFEYDKLIHSIYTLKYLRDPQLHRKVHRSQNRIFTDMSTGMGCDYWGSKPNQTPIIFNPAPGPIPFRTQLPLSQ
jgi:hypothetical protein